MPDADHISDRETLLATDLAAEDTRQAPTIWQRGVVVDGQYKVLDIFGGPGQTGMGVVYIVERDGKHLAAKTFQYQFSKSLSLVERFMREARTWILLGFHPHIVHAYAVDIIGAAPFLFMEYVQGGNRGLSLADWLAHGPVALADAVRLAVECCDGMIHATAAVPGLVHRDLKPENLLINEEGVLKISDFGLVRCALHEEPLPRTLEGDVSDSPDLTQVGTVMGTPAYMAPEQFAEPESVAQQADIYAFGCCMYEAISGERVFAVEGRTPMAQINELRQHHLYESPVPLRMRAKTCPEGLDHVVMRCLRKDRDERWRNWRELRDALVDACQGLATLPPEPIGESEPAPVAVAEQVRALTLLEGYGRAIRQPSLREQSHSPYSFHLALASYFFVHDEPDEERRQLEKALRASREQEGYEATRRLAELHLRAGRLEEAQDVIEEYLKQDSGRMDNVLEPYIELLLAKGDFDTAQAALQPFAQRRRGRLLLARLYERAGRVDDFVAMAKEILRNTLDNITADVDCITAESVVGWDQPGDWYALQQAMAALAPEADSSRLDACKHCVWPRLDGYPDFSADMAYLSQVCGELAAVQERVPDSERAVYGECAEILGYPERLERYLRRDESWLWTR